MGCLLHAVALLVLLTAPADAPEAPALTPHQLAQASSPLVVSADAPAPVPLGRLALTHTAAVATTLAIGALSVLSGWWIPHSCFEAQGRTDVLCGAAGLVLGAGVHVGLSYLLVPETWRLANDASARGSIAETRRHQWRLSRWAALAGLIFVSTYVTGALVEKNNYGKGQVAMLVGAVGTLGSWITFDVTQLLGASRGYQQSRRVQP